MLMPNRWADMALHRRHFEGIRRWVACHEAGHAVASWVMQRELGLDGCHFERIVVRTVSEAEAGAYITGMGCRIDCLGMVEEPARYQAVGRYVPDGMNGGVSRAEHDRIVGAWRRNMEADVIELLAGTLAEARCRRISRSRVLLSGGSGDYAAALRKAHDFARTEHDLSVMMAALWKRSAAVLRPPSRWAAVEALANALLERHVLEADEACAIIERAVRGVGAIRTPTRPPLGKPP